MIGLTRDAMPRSCPVAPAFYDYRDAHPMNDIRRVLEETVGDEIVGSDSFVFVTDERAGGLWVSDRDGYEAQTAAETLIVLLSEDPAGTTAPALALLHGTEMQVHGPRALPARAQQVVDRRDADTRRDHRPRHRHRRGVHGRRSDHGATDLARRTAVDRAVDRGAARGRRPASSSRTAPTTH